MKCILNKRIIVIFPVISVMNSSAFFGLTKLPSAALIAGLTDG